MPEGKKRRLNAKGAKVKQKDAKRMKILECGGSTPLFATRLDGLSLQGLCSCRAVGLAKADAKAERKKRPQRSDGFVNVILKILLWLRKIKVEVCR